MESFVNDFRILLFLLKLYTVPAYFPAFTWLEYGFPVLLLSFFFRLSTVILPVPEFVRFPIRPCFCCTYPILKEAQMNADDKSKLKAYEELIGSLEHTNGLQHRVIET